MGANITWYPITITVPSPFSGGAGCIVQLTTPLRQNIRTSQNGKPSTYVLKIPDGNGGWVVPGVTAGNPTPIPELDTAFPYPSGYKEENDGSFTQVDTNYTWDINKTGNSGDLPIQLLYSGGQRWRWQCLEQIHRFRHLHNLGHVYAVSRRLTKNNLGPATNPHMELERHGHEGCYEWCLERDREC